MVSHDRGFADSLCTRTVYLYNESRSFAGGRDCIAYDSYPCGLSKALELRQNGMEQSRGDWERLNSKAASEKQRSVKLEAENQKSKTRLSKKTIDSHDHDAKLKMDVARIRNPSLLIGQKTVKVNIEGKPAFSREGKCFFKNFPVVKRKKRPRRRAGGVFLTGILKNPYFFWKSKEETSLIRKVCSF